MREWLNKLSKVAVHWKEKVRPLGTTGHSNQHTPECTIQHGPPCHSMRNAHRNGFIWIAHMTLKRPTVRLTRRHDHTPERDTRGSTPSTTRLGV